MFTRNFLGVNFCKNPLHNKKQGSDQQCGLKGRKIAAILVLILGIAAEKLFFAPFTLILCTFLLLFEGIVL